MRTLHWLVVALALAGMARFAEAVVVFSDPFDDLSNWTIVDADGAGTAGLIESVGGKLHVKDETSTGPPSHGLYAGQVAPAADARVYFWSLNATGSRPPENPNNTGGAAVGAFNVSNTDGLKWFAETPVGFYVRNRHDVNGTGEHQTEAMRLVNNDNPGPFVIVADGVSQDFRLDYRYNPGSDTYSLFHWNKLSTAVSWDNLHVETVVAGSSFSGGGMYLNLTSLSDAYSTLGEGTNWTMEQIDITELGDAVLTEPVPEPVSAAVLLLGCAGMVSRRRRK